MNGEAPYSGECVFGDTCEARVHAACAVARALAELGVIELAVRDPRTCGVLRLHARMADLPKVILESAPGTTIDGPGITVFIDAHRIGWKSATRLMLEG